MSKPWLLMSDLHCHNFSSFSTILESGMNSRLDAIIREIHRAANELKEAGGNVIVIAGDIFHTRGSIDPAVFNPVFACFENLSHRGFWIHLIPGNHDLAGKETTELGNAVQTLGTLKGVNVYNQSVTWHETKMGQPKLVMIPWISKYSDLAGEAKRLVSILGASDTAETDLIIHAGINGVIMGMPDNGLDADEVASWGFKRVFAGHYHDHRVLADGKVISIGSTTHQKWSDVGTKAGFLLVTDSSFAYRATQAPAFVDLDETTDEDDIPLIVDGNFVRVRGLRLADFEVNQMRAELERLGAKGITFQVARQEVSARTGSSTPTKTMSLAGSVSKYIDETIDVHKEEVATMCEDILSMVTGKVELST